MRDTLHLSLHIVRRNWWIYRKDLFANLAPIVSDPSFYVLTLGMGLGSFVTNIEGRSYIAYLAPGLAISAALWAAFFEASYNFYFRMNYENIYKAMMTTPIGPNEIILGEFIWIGIKSGTMVLGVSLLLALFGLFDFLPLLLLTFVAGFIVSLPIGALALQSTCLVRNMNQFATVYSFLISPLFFFSGVFFPISQVPEPFRTVAEFLPMYHGVELGKALFWNQNVVMAFAIHGGILLLYTLVLAAIAHRMILRKLIQ